jgi:hypothetical protein
MMVAAVICTRLMPESSQPRCQAFAVKDAEPRTRGRLGAQHGSTQLLVRVHRVVGRSGADQPGLIRFFLRSARSKLRRCTLVPNRVSIFLRHCEVVSSGFAALRSPTKATTSAEIL